ncbi:MAG TPA: YoaK family protein, partial [Chthoniobacterales bacterium]|nr:YoaK family protein [Chthoniobacterales bacterium]
MNEPTGTAFRISIGLAFIGGYADASSFLLAGTFTGHLTGNCVLAAVSAVGKDWYLTADRLLAVIVFLGGILVSLILNRFTSTRLRPSSLAIAMLIEVLLFLAAFLFVSNRANELFIVCMCLALGIQNGALNRTNGISVHSTYMTGMVTTLIH